MSKTMLRFFVAVAMNLPLLAGSPSRLVNPLQGTDSRRDFSHGNTYPAVAMPFPMGTWAPQTEPVEDSFFYQYRSHQIRGIRLTHQPSPWMGDYGAFSLMPVSGTLAVTEEARASEFRHETEEARPDYYKVRLDRWKTAVEVTPTERCARFRFSFDQPKSAYVILDAFAGGSQVGILSDRRTVVGVARNNRGGVGHSFGTYFVLVFDQPFKARGCWGKDAPSHPAPGFASDHVGAYLEFNSKKVECKIGTSFISEAQARLNLEREIGEAGFETVQQRAQAAWDEALGRAQVEGGTQEQQRTFYSCLYRALLFPHRLYERNAQGQPIHYSPYDDKIHEGFLYGDSGYWDSFRAAHPLYNLLFPEISAEILQGLLKAYDESGWLPAWSNPGHRACMIGNHAFSLLADGWVKGIRSFDAARAVDAMVHDANTQSPPDCYAIGRDGAEPYNRMGFVPYPEFKESSAKTLEYAYDDFCAATLAAAIGRRKEAEQFAARSANWKNIIDRATGFARGRMANGEWCEGFDPLEWGGPFTEGSSWHWTWSVMHDIPGLRDTLGGREAFGRKLDAVFTTPGRFKVGSYGQVIHEMTEMEAANFGQYAHGNEPIHHMIYLYAWAGQPWKTQSRVRQVMSNLYGSGPDGFCGDEDTGQMAAWYVFSALGFYPVCPGTPDYILGSPLFDRAVLKLGAKTFTLQAQHNGQQRPYIQAATLEGQPFNRTTLRHEELLRGGTLMLRMDSAPNKGWPEP